MFKAIFISTYLSLIPLASLASNPVEITISGIQEKEGNILIAIFDEEEVWLDIPEAILLLDKPASEAKDGKLVFQTDKSLPKNVSITAYQDINEDNKLNKNFLGKPTEPYGFTNNIRHSTRSASFEEANITIPEDSKVKIEIDK